MPIQKRQARSGEPEVDCLLPSILQKVKTAELAFVDSAGRGHNFRNFVPNRKLMYQIFLSDCCHLPVQCDFFRDKRLMTTWLTRPGTLTMLWGIWNCSWIELGPPRTVQERTAWDGPSFPNSLTQP